MLIMFNFLYKFKNMYLYIDISYDVSIETNFILYNDFNIIRTMSILIIIGEDDFLNKLKNFVGNDNNTITKILSDNTYTYVLQIVKKALFNHVQPPFVDIIYIKKKDEFPKLCKEWLVNNNKF